MKLAFAISHIFFVLTCRPEVLLGFEVEVGNMKIKQQIYPNKSVLKADTWKMFTDIEEDTGYTIEFATRFGYGVQTINATAHEVAGELSNLLDRIYSQTSQIVGHVSYWSFRNSSYLKLNSFKDKLTTVFDDCIYKDYDYSVVQTCMQEAARAVTAAEIPNYGGFCNLQTVSYLKKHNFDTAVALEHKLTKMRTKNIKNRNLRAKIYELDNLMYQMRSYFHLKVDRCYYRLTENDFPHDQNDLDKFFEESRTIETQCDPTVFDKAIRYMIARPNQYSAMITKDDGDLHVDKEFQIFFIESQFEIVARDPVLPKYNVFRQRMEPKLGVQLTYQFPLSSFVPLFQYFAKQRFSKYVPQAFITLSRCVIGEDLCMKIKNKGSTTLQAVLGPIMRNDAKEMMDKEHRINSGVKHAKGLFYLVISYIIDLFDSPDESKIEAERNDNLYGPKKALPLMSRVSFSEMYDGLDPTNRKIFKEAVHILCGVGTSNYKTKKHRSRTSLNSSYSREDREKNCRELKLVGYQVMQGFGVDENGDSILHSTKLDGSSGLPISLTLFDWLSSIVEQSQRLPPQLKIVNQNPASSSEEISFTYEKSDRLSPPPGYERTSGKLKAKEFVKILSKKFGSKVLYSMGAYTGVEKNHAIIEFRSYAELYMPLDEFTKFIENQTKEVFPILENSEPNETLFVTEAFNLLEQKQVRSASEDEQSLIDMLDFDNLLKDHDTRQRAQSSELARVDNNDEYTEFLSSGVHKDLAPAQMHDEKNHQLNDREVKDGNKSAAISDLSTEAGSELKFDSEMMKLIV